MQLWCRPGHHILAFTRLIFASLSRIFFFFLSPAWRLQQESIQPHFAFFLELFLLRFGLEIQIAEMVNQQGATLSPRPQGKRAEPTRERTPKSTSFICCKEDINARSSTGSHLFCLSCGVNSFFSFPETKGPATIFFLPSHISRWGQGVKF